MNLQAFIKRYGIAIIVLCPLFIAGSGAFFSPWSAVILLVVVVAAAMVSAYLSIQQQGRSPLLREMTKIYGMGKGTGLFYCNITVLYAVAFLCWSTSFWGKGPSGKLAALIALIPHNGEVSPTAGNIIGPILFMLLGLLMFLGVKYGKESSPARKQVGTLGAALTCLLAVGYAFGALASTPFGSICFLVKYVALIGVIYMALSYKYEVGLLFRGIWSGGDRKVSPLAVTVIVLTVMVIPASVGGRFLNLSLVQAIDNLAETELAQSGMKDLNIPLYIVSGILMIASFLLLLSRMKGGVEGGSVKELRVQLTKSDGTLLYSTGGSSALITKEIVEIVVDAVECRASDIHVEPEQNGLQIRYRIDGVLSKRASYPAKMGRNLVSSIKATANMDIAERRKPQDGRFSGMINDKLVDFRVASTPMSHGEKIVIRVLDQEGGVMSIGDLGFPEEHKVAWEAVIHRPQGIVIVCGPTGSGKTTTIYSTLGLLDVEQLNIITIEDPIEYRLPGVTQTAINEKAGVTFSSMIRSSLRQDPDVIFVGEVRDRETADVAMQASTTGHVVLTTVHATDVCACFVRLKDLGVNDKNVISFSAILSQRLVRNLCAECAVWEPVSEEERSILKGSGPVPEQLMRSRGCPKCENTGFRGRTAIYELVVMKDWMRDLFIADNAPSIVKKALREKGFKPMWHDGVRKVLEGLTTLEEVQRVTVPDD